MSLKHTPTPYIIQNGHIKTADYNNHIASIPEESDRIFWGQSDEQAKANVAFIVRACNVHEELVSALDRLYQAIAYGLQEGTIQADLIHEICAATKAIAKAKGGE